VVTALLSVFAKTQPPQATLRERILWAMGNIGDLRFGPAFVAALDTQDAVAVRLAAVRGIGALKNPQLADALATAVSDPDPGVRKLAIGTLASLGSGGSDKQIQALWERVASPQETDETIRQAAWRGVLDILSKGSAEDVERWLARMPSTTPQDVQRRVELLEQLAKMVEATEPLDRARLGLIRARLAVQRARLEQPSEAVGAFVAALADLHGAKSDAAQRVALELLHYALVNGRYDETVATALAATNPGPDRQALWQAAKAEVESRLTPAGADQALALLAALERFPPQEWPADARAGLAELRERAQRIKQMTAEATTTSPTASAPASQPVEQAARGRVGG
jgi:HEAT repeat protein